MAALDFLQLHSITGLWIPGLDDHIMDNQPDPEGTAALSISSGARDS